MYCPKLGNLILSIKNNNNHNDDYKKVRRKLKRRKIRQIQYNTVSSGNKYELINQDASPVLFVRHSSSSPSCSTSKWQAFKVFFFRYLLSVVWVCQCICEMNEFAAHQFLLKYSIRCHDIKCYLELLIWYSHIRWREKRGGKLLRLKLTKDELHGFLINLFDCYTYSKTIGTTLRNGNFWLAQVQTWRQHE